MKTCAWLLSALLFLLASAHAAEVQTDIIYSSRASELAPVLSPLASPEGSVSAYQDQLIIRATPDKLDVIRDALGKLDRPLKNLRISVRRQQQGTRSGKEVSGKAKVRIQNGDVSGRAVITADEQHSNTQSSDSYSITAMEGSTVYISTGSDVPVLTVIRSNNSVAINNLYVPVQSGMQVTPRLTPDNKVLLAIDFQQATVANRQGVIHRENTQTQLQLPLGSWTSLSQIDRNSSSSSSGLGGQGQQKHSSSTPLEILVEETP